MFGRERERCVWGGGGKEKHQFKVKLRDVAIQLWLPCYLEVSSPLNLKQLSQDSLTLGALHVLPPYYVNNALQVFEINVPLHEINVPLHELNSVVLARSKKAAAVLTQAAAFQH